MQPTAALNSWGALQMPYFKREASEVAFQFWNLMVITEQANNNVNCLNRRSLQQTL
jgi:hypothetical protein